MKYIFHAQNICYYVYTILIGLNGMFQCCKSDMIFIKDSYILPIKVEECNEPSCETLIFPYGVVLFNIFSTICI